jgi:hypothetical protein
MPQETNFGNNMAPWQQTAAFNTYWTYSYISNAGFYAQISPAYRDFMLRWVQNWLWWYDGWVPYFHNQDQGIFSTRIASALVDRVAQKVVGGRVMFKNAGKERQQPGGNAINNALREANDWARDTEFNRAFKQCIKYAAAAGTSLIKLNRSDKNLWAEAVRFDRFVPQLDSLGRIMRVKCFLVVDISLSDSDKLGRRLGQSYSLVEERYFGDYTKCDGTVIHNAPIAEYKVYNGSASVTNGNDYQFGEATRIEFKRLPETVRKRLLKNYGTLLFDTPILLPFDDSLGCELVTWTDGIGNLPQLPFGESFLAKIISYLMTYDYYWSAFNTDMYLGRGRVLVPSGIAGVGAGQNKPAYNTGLDGMMYQKLEYTNPDEQKPFPIQFELRAEEWAKIRNTIIENIAVNTGLSSSTVASFISDNSAKTAREISTEENETAGYVNDIRTTLEVPLNRILRAVLDYHGYDDNVEIRWSAAGLTNRVTLTEIISSAVQGGYLSKKKAVQMFNYDDDEEQVQEEFLRIVEDEKTGAFGDMPVPEEEGDYFGEQRSEKEQSQDKEIPPSDKGNGIK